MFFFSLSFFFVLVTLLFFFSLLMVVLIVACSILCIMSLFSAWCNLSSVLLVLFVLSLSLAFSLYHYQLPYCVFLEVILLKAVNIFFI